jgi:Domain of unknown function (DUF4410)
MDEPMNLLDAVAGNPYATGGARSAAAAARAVLGVMALSGLMSVNACTSTESQVETGGQMLPRPAVVVVDSFAISPTEVTLNEGLTGEVKSIVSGRSTPRSQQELQVGHQVADAIADNLVTEIRDMGLPAQRGRGLPSGVRNAVLVSGQLVSIDEGNQAERVAIGFGAGRSDVRAQVQVLELTPDSTKLIDTIEVDAKSGLTPGMAETMGAGALTGHLLVSTLVSGGVQVATQTMSDTVVADADRAAKGIAKQLSSLFTQQGWFAL